MNMQKQRLSLALGLLALIGVLTAWGAWGYRPPVAQAQGPLIRYVAPAGIDASDCADPAHPCATVQYAVDQAGPGDEIRVATGVYTDVQSRVVPPDYPNPPASGFITQTVYISKTVTIRGGYTAAFAGPPDPDANPTTLDAQGRGRVLYITGHITPTIEGLHITGGNAVWLGGWWGAGSAGGGIYVLNATAALRNNRIFSNTTWSSGLSLRGGTAALGGKLFVPETSRGGGVFLWSSAATFSGNTVTANRGSGLALYKSPATLSDNIITANTDGGLYLRDSAAMLVGNTVTSNTDTYGGGLRLYSSPATLSNNIIAANAAHYYGGGLHMMYSAATLSGNTITTNTAGYWGGGLFLHGSDATLSGNTVTANTAGSGGGLVVEYYSAPTLNGNIVTANTARGTGGGLALSQGVIITSTNDIVADNQAHASGSGLYVSYSSARLRHTTIARNSGGDGSGIYVREYSTVVLTNTILVSHTVGLTVTAGGKAMLAATLWGTGTWANGTNTGGEGIVSHTQDAVGDPAFADPAAGDYHIGPGSAAINAGVDAGVGADIDHQPRPYQTPDLGADEYWPPGVLKYFYLPLALRNHVP